MMKEEGTRALSLLNKFMQGAPIGASETIVFYKHFFKFDKHNLSRIFNWNIS